MYHHTPLDSPADTQQKGFYGRSLRKLESLLDKGSSNPLALEPDLSSRMSGEQVQLLHLNRALVYYLSGEDVLRSRIYTGHTGCVDWRGCVCGWRGVG